MATLIRNTDVKLLNTGILVTRPSTATGNTPLTTGGLNIFTVSGGRILLRLLVGEVTTVIQSQTTNVKFTSTPTTGSAIDLSANVDCNALQAGGRVTLANPPAAATATVKTNAGYTNLSAVLSVVAIGSISVTYGAASTGALQFDLVYVPLDAGAQVVATA